MSKIARDIKSPSRRIEGLISIFDKSNLTDDQKEILLRLKDTATESQELIRGLIEATRFQSNIELKKISANSAIIDLK